MVGLGISCCLNGGLADVRVSDDGATIAGTIGDDISYQAFRWKQDTGMELAPGVGNSSARDLTSDGGTILTYDVLWHDTSTTSISDLPGLQSYISRISSADWTFPSEH
jgi:hypothetical protein